MDPRLVDVEGLRGLNELRLRGIDGESREGEVDLYRVIGPTLRTLSVDSGDLTWFAQLLPLFSQLSRLSIGGFYSNGDPDPTPLSRCLPQSLSPLRLGTDD